MIRHLAALGVALVVAGCGSREIGTNSTDQLLTQLPSPLPQTVATTQELTTPDQVAAATPADATVVQQMLVRSSFNVARARVWTKDASDYVTVMAITFGRAADAVALVRLEANELGHGGNTYVTPHAQIASSFVFVIHGATRQGGNPVVCEGVWAPVLRYAVETLTCSATGDWAQQAETLAQQETDLLNRTASP